MLYLNKFILFLFLLKINSSFLKQLFYKNGTPSSNEALCIFQESVVPHVDKFDLNSLVLLAICNSRKEIFNKTLCLEILRLAKTRSELTVHSYVR